MEKVTTIDNGKRKKRKMKKKKTKKQRHKTKRNEFDKAKAIDLFIDLTLGSLKVAQDVHKYTSPGWSYLVRF